MKIEKDKPYLRTVDGKETLDFNSLQEFGSKGQALEVYMPWIPAVQIKPGASVIQRFSNFFPFEKIYGEVSLGEGETPLLPATEGLKELIGIQQLFLKNETVNPTWSFKDRGTWAALQMAKNEGETVSATVSTGNMGNSTAAYCARSGIEAMIIVPHYTSMNKIKAASLHGAKILKVQTNNYSDMKAMLALEAPKAGIRVTSGNNPIRVEGYKLTAFEIYEQFGGQVPDYIAIPTSACGHIRGVFKGFFELKQAGLIMKLPKMVILQAENNAPLVNALKEGKPYPLTVEKPDTIASAITTGNPLGGEEIIAKANLHNWLYESVSEEEIIEGQKELAKAGFYVETATATVVYGLKKLASKIKETETVVAILTGSGLKDTFGETDLTNVSEMNDEGLKSFVTNYPSQSK